MTLWEKNDVVEPNCGVVGGPPIAPSNGGSNGSGYVSLRSSSGSQVNLLPGGGAFLRCCVYRLANFNIRRWILALVLITVLSIVCYTRLIDAPFTA